MALLQFKGKQFVQNHHLTVKFHELVPKKDKSLAKKAGLNDNLIIHGDNLKALKALLPTYGGKVKCIYIDPPYNTGNEKWKYNDNVNSPMMQEWLGKVVDKEDLTRHDKWLCMMTPRLKLLRELLRDDGVIFISIDDNEQHHLRMLMDEIFGEENFVAQFAWRKTDNQANIGNIANVKEYILCFCKIKENFKFNKMQLSERAIKEYRYQDKKGQFRRAILLDKTRGKNIYDFKTPSGKILKGPWMVKEEMMKEMMVKNEIYWTKGGDEQPYGKIYLEESDGQITSDWLSIEFGTNQQAALELEDVFGKRIFDFPKPSSLIKHFLTIATDKNDIILDSFAGTGTTAHAVLNLNREDDGKRQFILVECEDYADSITAERLRRVIKRLENPPQPSFTKGGGKQVPPFVKGTNKLPPLEKGARGISSPTFSYFELGKPIEMESILSGKNLPTYKELARYVFYTATGEEFDEKAVKEADNFIGESKEYKVYLFYKPDIEYLKNIALTLDRAKALGKYSGKKRLVFAPTKYLDQDHLDQLRIDFAQLPFEIYKLTE